MGPKLPTSVLHWTPPSNAGLVMTASPLSDMIYSVRQDSLYRASYRCEAILIACVAAVVIASSASRRAPGGAGLPAAEEICTMSD